MSAGFLQHLKPTYRITATIPVHAVNQVTQALRASGILSGSHYSDVFWVSAAGYEHFTPLPGSNPAVGAVGQPSQVESVQLTCAIPHDAALLEQIICTIQTAHPWEAPVIFIDTCLAPL